MAVGYFVKGHEVEIDGAIYVIARQIAEDEWQLEHKETGRYAQHTTQELMSLYVGERLRFPYAGACRRNGSGTIETPEKKVQPLDMLPEERRESAKVRYAYVMAIKEARLTQLTPETLRPVIEATWQRIRAPEQPPHWSTVYRWWKRFIEARQDIRALVARESLKGNRTRRYDGRLLELVQQAVSEIYLAREPGTLQDTVERAVELVRRENQLRPQGADLPLPTRSLVRAAIDAIPAFDRAVARKGMQVALREFRSVLGGVVATMPLERAEIDHTRFDIMIVDDKTWFPLGRPTLTACIDVMTRCVLGIYIGFEPPSFSTVAQCLKHAFLPKVELSKRFPAVKNEWDCYGIMETLVVDNGMEFHAKSLEALCYPFGVTIQYMPRKVPWYKGTIERFLGTMNRGVAHGKPGTTFASVLEKEDYDAAKKATITLSTFIELVHVWIVDYYHFAVHKTLGRQPIKVWREFSNGKPIPLPSDPIDLDSLLGAVAERVVTHKGVELHGLFYNSKELGNLRAIKGAQLKATIRYNPCDIGHIYVFPSGDDGRSIRVPALKASYAKGLSLWQHGVCKRYAREHLDRSDVEALAEAKQRIRELIKQDMKDKRIKTMSKAHRFMSSGGQESTAERGETARVGREPDRAGPENGDDNTKGVLQPPAGAGASIDRAAGLQAGSLPQPRVLKVLIEGQSDH